MTIWLIMILGGMVTLGMRFSFVYWLGRLEVPEAMRRALHYIPPAVLSAIIFPELFLRNDHLEVNFGNPRLSAGLIAVAVAAWTKNSLLTILAGMVALVLLQVFGV